MKYLNALLFIIMATACAPAYASNNANKQCYEQAAYHEARGEGNGTMWSVMQTVKNRVADRRWPSSACSVVWQKSQFSWTADKTKASLKPAQPADKAALAKAKQMSYAIHNKKVPTTITANHFFRPDQMKRPPAWASCSRNIGRPCVEFQGKKIASPDFIQGNLWFYTL